MAKQLKMNPPYQRNGGIWSDSVKRGLIYSLCQGYDIPKFYLHENEGKLDVVDGKQRIMTIIDFLADGFKLGMKGDNYQKFYSELPPDLKLTILGRKLDFAIMSDADEEVVREMFLLHQAGSPLSAAEKMHAIGGWLQKEITSLTTHPVFSVVAFDNKRFQYESHLLKIVHMECTQNFNVDRVGAATCKKLVRNYKDYDNELSEALAIVRSNLDLIHKVFCLVPGTRINAGAFIYLYSVVSQYEPRDELAEHLGNFWLIFEEQIVNALKRRAEADGPFIEYAAWRSVSQKIGWCSKFMLEQFSNYVSRRRGLAA